MKLLFVSNLFPDASAPGHGQVNATVLHQLGLDHRRVSFPHHGRNETLTDAEVTGAKVVTELLA